MKITQIFFSKKGIFVLTLYRLESWSYIASNPIYEFDKMYESKEIIDSINSSLNYSRELNENEENKYWLGKNLLKKVKHNSFNSFYKNSDCFQISLIDGNLKIVKLIHNEYSKGLEESEEYCIFKNCVLFNEEMMQYMINLT